MRTRIQTPQWFQNAAGKQQHHGYETAIIRRLPSGEYIEVTSPVPSAKAAVLAMQLGVEHDGCAVIDFEAWHGPVIGGEEAVEPRAFSPRRRDDDTIEADELARRRDDLVVVDARLPARWRGEPNPVDKLPGRIPGALNAPWNEPVPELPAGELVAYCGSGVTAAVVLHRLDLTGREGRLYPGSWSEWEQLDLPVERSAAD